MGHNNVPRSVPIRESHRHARRPSHMHSSAQVQAEFNAETVLQEATDQSWGDQNIQPGALSIGKYARSIRPVAIVDALPTLPDENYPINSYVVVASTSRLWKNIAEAWVLGVDGADIVADSITAGQIAAGAVSATEIAAGAITADKLAVGAIGLSLLRNGDFELGTTTYGTASTIVPSWTIRGDTEWKVDISVNVKSGTKALFWRSVAGVAAGGLSQTVSVIPGRTYRLSGWLWKASGGGAQGRLRLVTIDSAGATVAFDVVSLHNSTTTIATYREGTYTVPSDGTVSALRVDYVSVGTPAAGEVFLAEDIALELIPAGARNTSGTVLIDDTGITIKDEFSEAVMTAAGFSGSWTDFVSLGLYNARFLYGTIGALAMGRTSAMPYWTLAQVAGSPTATKLSGGGVEVKFSALSDVLSLSSDLVPVHQGVRYAVPVYASRFSAGGGSSPAYSVKVSWYTGASALISTSTLATGVIDSGLYEAPTVVAPTTSAYAKIIIEVTEDAFHHASSYYRIMSVAFLRVTQQDLSGLALEADSVAVTNQLSILGTGIFDANGRVLLGGVISPTALAADTNDWDPTGFPDCYLIRVGTDATPRTLSGIAAGDDGQVIWLHNRNASTALTLAHNVTSIAGNRFLCPGATDYSLTGKSSVQLIYSSTDSRWLVLG